MSTSGKITLAVVLTILLAGCATGGRILSYGTGLADAKFTVEGEPYSLWLHPREDSIMLQHPLGMSVLRGARKDLPIVGIDIGGGDPWARAAQAFVSQVGCDAINVRPIDKISTWEADVHCPAGVDFRSLVEAQRSSLRDGAPLRR